MNVNKSVKVLTSSATAEIACDADDVETTI